MCMPVFYVTQLRFLAHIGLEPYVGARGPMGLYGQIVTIWNGGAYQLKFPADQLKLHGCVQFTKETCVCGFKMSKKWSFGPIRNEARPIVAAGRPHMTGTVHWGGGGVGWDIKKRIVVCQT